MAKQLLGKRVAILATNGFEQVELLEPRKALEDAGARTEVVSPTSRGKIRGWNYSDWGTEVSVDVSLDKANASNYDAVLLPGGVINPDKLRMIPDAVKFVRAFFDSNKPIASICHGPWMLVEADIVRGRKIASWPSLKTDIRNAGGHWIDEEVVVDDGIVTSRMPDDIPAFNLAMIKEFTRGVELRRTA